ncbi:ABC transporter ATP-binding protein [Paraburkholderia azotifigens]|uniref:ABC transporter ATP-binding protein n=1 Tax=Paraburkholderia azotifigens TaxID=2057004 RepID=A0A5C6VUV7_9BURK|nr:ABC transporter ATP-binding protein [Paraburkholderia azotifigens]TXC87198.1 ABC transporter ATP-binding protein [Paraburkholderia azotifigens]
MIPAIAVRRLDKRFGATRVLRGIDLLVEPHERHALIGPNGAGKSTLFNLIAGAARPSAGRIELYGADITRLAPAAICRRGLARSFQTTRCFAKLSVFDNLRCAAQIANRDRMRWWQRYTTTRAADEAAEAVLESVALGERRDAMAGTLSYAEQRALDLGLALASGAHTLLLDEPTAGMNRAEAARAVELIRSATAGRTLLMVEHDMDVVFRLADRISVLVQGEVIATGTPEAIRADPAVLTAYLGDGVGEIGDAAHGAAR